MAGYSARQSSFTTGDTITAAHSNDEFNQVLAAFNATTGHTHDGTAGEGGPVGSIRDADSLNKILVDSTNNHLEFYVEVSSSAVQQFRIQDGAIVPITDNDIDLGTSSLEFKDLYIDGTAYVDTLSLDGTAVTATGTEINLIDGGATVGTTAVADGDGIIHNDDGTMRVTSATTFKTYFQTGVTAAAMAADDLSAGDSAVTLSTSSGNITIDATANDTDIIFKGTDNSSDITMLTLDGSEAGKATFNSDVVVGGDLTVTGDDITMGTNTSGNILVADGTNFNSIAVGDLSAISTVAADDVLLAVDTSGGGLKKIARSALVSGLAAGTMSNIVEDTSPQLGGDLDTNSANILIDDAHFIGDENGNEQIIFQTTSSAVNQFDVTNAATGNPPQLSSTGGDSNIDLNLLAKGTGHVTVLGNSNSGAIQFNCENNSHGQILKAQPHSASVTNVMLLPAGSDSTLVSLISTDTLTNKTLTTPVIAEIDSGADITLDATADIVLDAGGADVTLKDDGTTFGSLTNSSGELVIKSGSTPTTAMTFSGANVTFAGTVTIGSAGISEAELEILDGATATTAELNIIDGDTSATSTTLADADRVVTNDAGTMKQVALSDVKTYLTSAGFVTDDPTALAIALG